MARGSDEADAPGGKPERAAFAWPTTARAGLIADDAPEQRPGDGPGAGDAPFHVPAPRARRSRGRAKMLAAGLVPLLVVGLALGVVFVYKSPGAPQADAGSPGGPTQAPLSEGGEGGGYPWTWPSPTPGGTGAGGTSPGTAPYGGGPGATNPAAGGPGTTTTTPAPGSNPGNRPPSAPSAPDPADGSTGTPVALALKWTASDADGDPLRYNVYFGTSSPPTEVRCANVSVAECDVADLHHFKWYWWRVEVSGGADTVAGPNWKFQTQTVGSGGDLCPTQSLGCQVSPGGG